jgi:hypothetical protein
VTLAASGLSNFALCLGSTGCCSARTQLIALTGVTLAASDFSSLSISAWAARAAAQRALS